VTTTQNRDFIRTRIGELATAYEALQYQVARGSGGQVPGHRGRGEPPSPIRSAVVDAMSDIEAAVLRLHSRAYVLLGWHLSTVRLARDGQWLPCPDCGSNGLRINREDWCVFCSMPGCGRRWSWGAEINLLGEVLDAQGLDGASVPERALEVAQEVANDLGADTEETGMKEARSA
jgi:hypothetical protein